jgi:hypothetical protein
LNDTTSATGLEIAWLAAARMDEERLIRLLAVHPDDSDLPEKSAFHRVLEGDFKDVFGPVSQTYGHGTRTWREFVKGMYFPGDVRNPDVPDDVRIWMSARNWIAITQIFQGRQRIRIFDELDNLVAVVTCVTEGASFHSVRSLIAVEDIKRKWERNPHWSLADTPGLSGHAKELGLHSSEWIERREEKRLAERLERIDAMVEASRLDPRILVERLLDVEERMEAISKRLHEMERYS